MRSEKQIEASRRNGAKSKGPTTDEGKAISSRNALAHGLTAESIVVKNENPDEFIQFHNEFIEHYQPQGPVESELVLEIASTRWRMRRILRLEAGGMDWAFEARSYRFKDFPNASAEAKEAIAFHQLADGKFLIALNRYESRARNSYQKATTELTRLQSERKKAEQQLQNEPKKPAPRPAQNHDRKEVDRQPMPSPWLTKPLQNEPEPVNLLSATPTVKIELLPNI